MAPQFKFLLQHRLQLEPAAEKVERFTVDSDALEVSMQFSSGTRFGLARLRNFGFGQLRLGAQV